MSFEPDRLLDRRRLKRGVAVWRAIAVVALVAFIVVAIGRFVGGGSVGGDHVVRVWVERLILDDPERDATLRELAEDSDVKALVVRIDSPGGTMAGGEALYLALRHVALRKPVAAVMGSTATSGGYMAALAADHIVARNSTITGSIGVIYQTAEITALLDDLGIETEAIKSAPLKGQPSPLEPLDEAARAASKAVVDDMYELFLDMVIDRRNMARDEALKVADGRIFTGRQALAGGLIDEIGGEHEALEWLSDVRGVEEDLPIRDFDRDDGEGWMGVTSAIRSALLPQRLALDGLMAVWHPSLTR